MKGVKTDHADGDTEEIRRICDDLSDWHDYPLRRRIFDFGCTVATDILSRHWPAVEQVAQELLQHGTITGVTAHGVIDSAACHTVW